MRTSVGSVAGSPFCGSIWMKSLAGSAARPDRLVEAAVERDALAVGQAHRFDETAWHPADQVLPLENQLLGRGGRRQEGERERAEQRRDSDSGNQ